MNSLIGERKITLAGKSYVMRPCFEAYAMMEDLAGAGIIEMFQRFSSGKARAKDTAAVVYACIVHGTPGFELTFAQVGNLIHAEGMFDVSRQAFPCVMAALSNGKKKETAAPAEPQTESSGEVSTVQP
jgi:hypothetical protein